MYASPFVSPVSVGTVPGRPCTVALYQMPPLPCRRKGCRLLPETICRVHLHSVVEGRFLIWKLDFYVRQDVRLAAQEERDQARFWAVVFLTHGIVAWLAAVVNQL